MIYTDFKGDRLSMLGMGCMRFPVTASGDIDYAITAQMIDLCIKSGVNYFDSAWFYHDGKSEEIMGDILKNYDRSSFFFATKMPWTDINKPEDAEGIFKKQLEKTKLDYFDYYLIHNVCEETIDIFTDENLRIIEFLSEQKKQGKIRHLGFSTHGSLELMEKFINDYRDKLDFCQIQLNWLDWTLQDAKEKVKLLNRYNLPIWVMEPVRGGRLAKLSCEDENRLKNMRRDESIAAWSFRFLQSIDNVKMILSGMSSIGQVTDNLKTFSENKPLNEREKEILFEIAERILSKKTLACTNCRYCTSECPAKLNIPELLGIYNDEILIKDDTSNLSERIGENDSPSLCIGCKKCEKKCPQGIEISKVMGDFSVKLKG